MRLLQTFVRWIDAFSEGTGRVVFWLTSLMVVVVCYDVFTRYVLNKSLVAVQELEWHIFSLVFLLGAAYTLKHDAHVRVDVLYSRLSARGQALIDFVGCIVLLIPFSLLMVWTSVDFIKFSYMVNETSPDPGGLPMTWLIKTAIPVGFIMVTLQGFSMCIRALLTLLGAPLATTAPKEN